MGRALASVMLVLACTSPPAAARDAGIEAPSAGDCVPAVLASWGDAELTLSASGTGAVMCVDPITKEPGPSFWCALVEPRTGAILGPAAHPVAPVFAPRREDPEAVTVCDAGRCRVVPTPDNLVQSFAIDAAGARVFVIGRPGTGGRLVADTIELATGKRLKRTQLESLEPEGIPPPPIDASEVRIVANSAIIGGARFQLLVNVTRAPEFVNQGALAELEHELLALVDSNGEAWLIDAKTTQIVASRPYGKPRVANEGVAGSVIRVPGGALITTWTPPSTIFVDAAARTLSKPRKLRFCEP